MQVQKVAKTVNLAIDEALNELNTTIDNIEYTILQEPSKGFLGIGSRPAKVLVKLKDSVNSTETKTENINKNFNTFLTIVFKIQTSTYFTIYRQRLRPPPPKPPPP